MWLIVVAKFWFWILIGVVAGAIALARAYWWVRDMLPLRWLREEEPREMSETYNKQQFQASEPIEDE